MTTLARWMTIAAAAAALAGGCAVLRGSAEHARLLAAAAPPKTAAVGAENCVDCHSTIGDFVAASVHAKAPGCESCHGPGEAHLSDGPGNILGRDALAGMSATGRSEMCRSCHSERRLDWLGSDHARADVACESCHADAVHWKPKADAVEPPASFPDATGFCSQCHADAAAEFRQPFRHPVAEGEMTCASCHAPHGEDARRLHAGGGDDRCASCHADQAAPKVFRHDALEDGCATCHATHGSAVPGMLKQDGNGLCVSCHLEPGFPVIGGFDHRQALASGARCWDCHTETHGSNSDPGFLGRIR